MQWAVREAASNFATGKAEDEASDLLKIVRMLLKAGSNTELSSNPKSVDASIACNPMSIFVTKYMHTRSKALYY